MLHHERLKPPSHDYPADEWNVIEKRFHPEFLAQLETMLALGNGYLGMRGCPEEGGPNAENSTLINGFYETRPIVYAEEAYGFAKTGQTIFSVTDSKIIKLLDRKSTRLNSSHANISYAVFCLKKKETRHRMFIGLLNTTRKLD